MIPNNTIKAQNGEIDYINILFYFILLFIRRKKQYFMNKSQKYYINNKNAFLLCV